MNWLNLPTHIARAPEFIGSEPTQRATWLSVMLYSVEQENAGRIRGARAWKDRQWQQSCGVTITEADSAAPLLTWEGADLIVWAYPTEKELEVQAKRHGGRLGGLRSAQNRAGKEVASSGRAQLEAQHQRKGKEMEIEVEGNLPGLGAATAAPVERPRNALIDALAGIDGSNPEQVTRGAWGAIAKALKEIKAVCPNVSPEEIARRAANYRAHMPQVTISPSALAKHWARCETPPTNQQQDEFGSVRSNAW